MHLKILKIWNFSIATLVEETKQVVLEKNDLTREFCHL